MTATTTTTFQVSGMSCGHCEQSVRSELAPLGVEIVELSAADGRLVVSGADIDSAQVIAAVDEAGYEAVKVG